MESRERSVSPTASKTACRSTSAKSHGSVLTHPDTLDAVKVADMSVDKVVAYVPSLPVSSPPVTPSSACASASAWTPAGAACAARSNGSVAPATTFGAAAAAARDHCPATTTRPAAYVLVNCDISLATARRSSSGVASPALKLPARTHSDSPATVDDPYPTAASPQSVERYDLPPKSDASPGLPPAGDSAPATFSVPSIGCSLGDAAFNCAAAPSVTVTTSAAASLTAAAGIQESRNGKAQAPVQDLRPEASISPTLPRGGDTVLVAITSTPADAAVACPEGVRSEETMICPHSLSLTSNEHGRHIHDSRSEGVASSSVLAQAAAASRSVGSAITPEHASFRGKDWPVEDQSGPAAELSVGASCTAVYLPVVDLRSGAATAAAGARGGDMPPTEIDLQIGGAGVNSSDKQNGPTAGGTSSSTVLAGSTADRPLTAAGHTYSAAAMELVLSGPATAEVGVLQAATTPARCGEDSVTSSLSNMSMQREQPHLLLEEEHRDFSSCKQQQQEERISDPQQGNEAATIRVRHRSAPRERALSLTLGQDEGDAMRRQRVEASPMHAHQTGAFSSVELRGENDSLLWRRAGTSPTEHLQKHGLRQSQEADAPLPAQQHQYVHSRAPRQKSVSARGEKPQEQHGLDTLLHNPLASLAELVSSPSPLGLSLTCSLGTSLLTKAEREQQRNSTVAEETQQHHHELQQQPSQQQLLTSAGDLLWKMGRRLGSGSRAAAEAAASAAAKAASVAAVATIGEPTVVTVHPKGSCDSHSTLSGAELCKQTGDDSSGGDAFGWAAARGSSSSSNASSGSIWSSIKNPTSNGADTTVKRCSNNGSSGVDNSALHNSSEPSTVVSNGSRSSSSGFHRGSPRASPSASDVLHADVSRTRILDEEIVQERDALREQVRRYQEAPTQLLEPPAQSQSNPRDRIDQDKMQQEVAASVDGGRLCCPSIVTPSKEKLAPSGAETHNSDSRKSFIRSKVRVRGAGAGRGCAAGGDAPEFAASSVDAAAAAFPLKDAAAAASASASKGATGAIPSSASDSDGRGLSATAGGTCERGRRARSDLGAHTSASQDVGWSAADAVEQLQQQLVELLCERAASAAAVAAATAAEATFSALLETRRGDQRIDTAAVAAATSVALTDDEELVRLLWQLLKQAASLVYGEQSDIFSADRHSCREPAAVLATLPTSEIDASLQHVPRHRRTRSSSSDCQRRVYTSRRGRSSTDKCIDKQGNVSDGTGSNRSESKALGSSSNDRHCALDACERQQFLAKIQQQQLELEQYRDTNERQTKQLMQLTLQLTSFKTEADNRKAAEQLERAWHSPEKEESAASPDAEKHEESAAIDAQQQQLEELAAAAAESFGLKCHLQELSKMYTKAAEREAALRQELEELRLQLTQQQKQSTRLQEDQGLAAKRRPQQDLRTDAAKREAQENEDCTEGATTTRRISPCGTPNQEIKRIKNRVATTADDEPIGATLMMDPRVQTTEAADSLPPAISWGAKRGDFEVLLTQKAERYDEAIRESSRPLSSAEATQPKGTADRERRTTATKQGTSVDAAAMLGASVSSYQDTAIGARECLETSPLSIAGEETTARGATCSSGLVPTDSPLVPTQADAATMYLDDPPPHAKGNMWNMAESGGDNQRKEELDRDQVPDAQRAAVSLETPSSTEKLPTAKGSSPWKEKDDKIPGFALQEGEVEQGSDLRIVLQRMRNLEVELESVKTQYSGERRRLQRHMLGLKTLCAKEKQRREKAEAQCERLMAAALEQQAFVLQKTPQREGVICGYTEEDRSISRDPTCSPVSPFCTSPSLQSYSVRQNRAEARNAVHRMKLPFDCSAYAAESFRNSSVGTTSGMSAAVSSAAPRSAVAPSTRDDHAQHDALANDNDGSDAACSSSIRQWKSTQTGTGNIFLRKSDNLSGVGDAMSVQYSETAVHARTAWRTVSTAEVYWVEEGGLKTATEECKDASTANKYADHSLSAPGLRELQKAYALAQEELQRVQESQTLLQADVIRKAEIISFLLKKYASEQEGVEAEDLSPCPHSFPWKPLNAASTQMAWAGGKTKAKGLTAAELQNLVEKMLAENIRLRSDLATLGFEFDRVLTQQHNLREAGNVAIRTPVASHSDLEGGGRAAVVLPQSHPTSKTNTVDGSASSAGGKTSHF